MHLEGVRPPSQIAVLIGTVGRVRYVHVDCRDGNRKDIRRNVSCEMTGVNVGRGDLCQSVTITTALEINPEPYTCIVNAGLFNLGNGDTDWITIGAGVELPGALPPQPVKSTERAHAETMSAVTRPAATRIEADSRTSHNQQSPPRPSSSLVIEDARLVLSGRPILFQNGRLAGARSATAHRRNLHACAPSGLPLAGWVVSSHRTKAALWLSKMFQAPSIHYPPTTVHCLITLHRDQRPSHPIPNLSRFPAGTMKRGFRLQTTALGHEASSSNRLGGYALWFAVLCIDRALTAPSPHPYDLFRPSLTPLLRETYM